MISNNINPPLKLHEITDCEVCGNSTLTQILDLGDQPLCDDLIPIGDNIESYKYPINILFCPICNTAHQRYQIPKNHLFPSTYHYRSRLTGDVINGMKELVRSCEEKFGSIKDLKVLDIGSNDGTLLGIFKSKGCKVLGVEPTNAALDAPVPTINDYFTVGIAEEIILSFGVPDIITFTNVFAHIEDLKSLIKALKILISRNTVVVIENHYLGSILANNQFDTFYHEHPRTYSLLSFYYIARSLGCYLNYVDFPGRYGGNIRVFLSKKSVERLVKKDFDEIKISEGIYNLQNYYEAWLSDTIKKLEIVFSEFGGIPGKAFPGRASIIITCLGLNVAQIPVIYEKPGSKKINHYVPGTRIPIKSDEELIVNLNSTKSLINYAWHITDEISQYLMDIGFRGVLIDIMPSYYRRTI